MLSISDEDSDSDGGCLLFDVNEHTPCQQPQTKTQFKFTFEMPLHGKIHAVQTFNLCNQSKTRTPHHHETSAEHYPISDDNHFTIGSSKRYVAPDNAVRVNKPQKTLSPSSKVETATKLLDHTTLGGHNLSELTSPDIQRSLQNLYRNDPRFLRECRRRDERNLFPDIDMNEGWNRARYHLEGHLQDAEGGFEERSKIQEGFAQFSLARQRDPYTFTDDACAGLFEQFFVGVSPKKSSWVREPGSWWGARKRLFAAGQGDLAMYAKETVKRIMLSVANWQSKAVKMGRNAPSRKRRHLTFAEETTVQEVSNPAVRPDKRIKPAGVRSEEVMSEAWRAKRILQEKKSGRWTDETLRMNRLWDHFHWVLNVDDPMDNQWGDQ